MNQNYFLFLTNSTQAVEMIRQFEQLLQFPPINRIISVVADLQNQSFECISIINMGRNPYVDQIQKSKGVVIETTTWVKDKLRSHGSETNDQEIIRLANLPKTEWVYKPNEVFISYINSIIGCLDKNKEQLVLYKITDDKISSYKSEFATFNDYIKQQQEHIVKYESAQLKIDTFIESLKERTRELMMHVKAFEVDYPDKVKPIMALLIIPNPKFKGIVSLFCKVTDEVKIPLVNATIELYKDPKQKIFNMIEADRSKIDELGPSTLTRTTGSCGICQGRDMEAGEYTVIIRMYGYETCVTHIFVNNANVAMLEVQLKKIPISKFNTR